MICDVTRYASYVEDFDVSAERKAELIRLVWDMMQSFVDRAFGDAPEQNLPWKTREKLTACGSDALDSGLTLSPTYNAAAGIKPARKSTP